MKKVKDYIKKNPEPAKGRFGVNPFDPWSVKYGIAEDGVGKSVGEPRSSVVDSPTLQRKNELDKKLQTQKIPNPPGSMHKIQNKPEGNQNTSLTPEEVEMKKTTVNRIREARESAKEKFARAAYQRDQEHKKFMNDIKDKPHAEKMKAMMDKIKSNLNKEEVEQMTTAQRVKSIYKKLKEDMTDWEKEDKSVQTYGKKPKLQTTKKEDSFGENKPEAALTMTGGTTLTGSKRDEVEIDPMMKKDRPGQPDVTNKKKDK